MTWYVPERILGRGATPIGDLTDFKAGGVEEGELGRLLRSPGSEGNHPKLELEVAEGLTGGDNLHEKVRWLGGAVSWKWVEGIEESEDL